MHTKINIVQMRKKPATVAQWHKSLAAVRLTCVAARLRRSGFNSRLWRLLSTCRSTKYIFRD